MTALPLSVTRDADNLAFRNQVRRRRRNRPESGRRARASFGLGETIADPSAVFDTSATNLFGCDLVFQIGSEGVIFESGDSTLGALVAVYSDNLIIRAGSGAAVPNVQTGRGVFPLATAPKGRRVRLSWSFEPSASQGLRVRGWIQGQEVLSDRSDDPQGSWSNAAQGGFDAVSGSVPIEAGQVLQPYSSGGSAIFGPLLNYT